MKKKKPITYNTLVNVSKNVLFTLSIENREEVSIQKDAIYFNNMDSYRYLYGGHAPSDLKDLLDWKHLHMLRYNWCKILYKYYQIFIPGLTLKKMWEIIKERRKTREEDNQKRWNRESFVRQVREDGMEIDGTIHRLFPLSADKYYQFVKEHTTLTERTKEKGGIYVDSENYSGYASAIVYKWRNANYFSLLIYHGPVSLRAELY
jgi:hypothetical protein